MKHSSATASVDAIALKFTGALDADVAADAATYFVRINGQVVEIESASYNQSTLSVSLGLPQSTLEAGRFWRGENVR